MPKKYNRILFDPGALRQLGSLPLAAQDCLVEAFKNIRDAKLLLKEQLPWRRGTEPLWTSACHHFIFASVNDDQNVVVITALLLDNS